MTVGARFIPLELRRQIAQHCDRASLLQLCLVQALWASECEPVLYARIGLCIGISAKENEATCACLHTLSTSARKASMVRALLVWYTPYVFSRYDNPQEFSAAELATRRVYETLRYLHNLVDLRIRAALDLHFRVMCDGLVEALAGDNCRISLATLQIPYGYKDRAAQVDRILRAQSATLRLLALHEYYPTYSCFKWYTDTLALHKDCVVFAIGDNVPGTGHEAILFRETESANILAVVRSLELDPILPPRTGAPNLNLVDIRWLQLGTDELPTTDCMSLLALYFPRCARLTFISTMSPAALLEPTQVAASAAHFPHLTELRLSVSNRELLRIHAPLDDDLCTSIAQAVVRAGCNSLRSVRFPDDTVLTRAESGDIWTKKWHSLI